MNTKIKHLFKEFAFITVKYTPSNDKNHRYVWAEYYILGIPIFKKIPQDSIYFFKKHQRDTV